MSYDQWKTASPYDDEPDPIEEAQRFIKAHADWVGGDKEALQPDTRDVRWAFDIIEQLVEIIEDNGL